GFHILSSLPRLFRGNEKYENLTRPQSIEQICDSESLNLGVRLRKTPIDIFQGFHNSGMH
ncbi:MAG: hypothetical protein PF517_10025, partial [Salinivirgaceae bacterium]|nr:hypothetical protein [Salinivirgaceae bacterium]